MIGGYSREARMRDSPRGLAEARCKQDPRRVREREIEWDELMQSANAGDRAAYHRLLMGISPVLRATAEVGLERAGRPADQCEIIVQETLLAVHLKRHTWNANVPFCSGYSRLPATNCWTQCAGPASRAAWTSIVSGIPHLRNRPSESRKTTEVDEHIQSLPQRQRIVLRSSPHTYR